MSNKSFAAAIVGILLLLNAYPLYQLAKTGGYLFYMNAYDESSYLQYDFSKATQSHARMAQFLVTAAHEAGLSGGWINLAFDCVTLTLFLVFTSRCFRLLGFEPEDANLYALLLATLPLLFGGLNPLVSTVFRWSLTSGAIRWITAPAAAFFPLLRTPEPQFSLAVLSGFACLALKRRAFWWVYPCIPFLYPSIALPAGFVVLALHLRQRGPRPLRHLAAALAASYAFLGAALAVYVNLLASDETRQYLVATRLPLVSVTAIVAALIGLCGFRRCPHRLRDSLIVFCVAPLAVANLQIVTGWLGTPNSFEQYFGVLCAAYALVVCFATGQPARATSSTADRAAQPPRTHGRFRPRALLPGLLSPAVMRGVLLVGGLALVALSSRNSFNQNYAANERLVLEDDVLALLRRESDRVAIDDQRLAAVASMIFPKQPSTSLAYERSFAAVCTKRQFRKYLRAKQAILDNRPLAGRFRELLATLDGAYRYGGADFVLLHNARKTEFTLKNDPDEIPHDLAPVDLHYVLVDPQPPPRPTKALADWVRARLAGARGPVKY